MADLPRGTVTFLFTDIESSTALRERDRAAMADAVDRHLALLRAAIETHGRVLFKTIGDAVQAAFSTAPDATSAALEAQRALVQEAWPEGVAPVCRTLPVPEAKRMRGNDQRWAVVRSASSYLNACHARLGVVVFSAEGG
jgi:hypothetical protein